MEIKTQLNKPYTNQAYAELAIYCNQNNCHIADRGEYLESVENLLPTEETYIQKRAAAYPAIGDQLDMIYWDQINGTSVWKDTITNIKNMYPKD